MSCRALALAGLVAALPAAAQVPAPTAGAPSTPQPSSVRAGVDLWRAGDWAGAVAIWRPFADQGDADAMFNIGQAYKLGRAVPLDKAVARDWYRKAALKNHLPAQANLGILLFQAGEKPEAARWLKTAADRGEMRAQYVLGVAHWNGDGVAKSMALAHAYLSRASAQGLGEATGALANLNRTITPADRANGVTIAASLAAGNGIPAGAAPPPPPMSAAELNRMNLEAVQRAAPASRPAASGASPVARPAAPSGTAEAAPRPAVPSSSPPPTAPPTAPTTAPATAAPPTAAPVPAPAATGTMAASSPTRSAPDVRTVELPTAPAPTPSPESAKPAAKPAEKPKPAEKTKAAEPAPGWRVQLGAFGKQAQAEAAWADVKAKQKTAIGSAKPIYDPGTSIIKLQMGPYTTRDAAKDACAKLAFAGRACFVIEAPAKKGGK